MALGQLGNTVRGVVRTVTVPPQTLYERNARNVMIDGLGVGLVSGVASFLVVFLIRLGASNLQVGLLTAMPAVTGALLSVPSGNFIQRRANIILWYARSRFWVLSSYALTGFVPFFAGPRTAVIVILIWAVATLPQTMVNVTFTLVMSAVAGPAKRMSLMSRRWSTLGITTAIAVALVGWALEFMPFPLGYQVVFIASFIGALISYRASTRIVIPEGGHVTTTIKEPWYKTFTGMRQLLREQPVFSRFLFSQFVFSSGMSMAIPLLPLYWVRQLHASDASIGLITTVNSAVLMIAYTIWILVARRYGARTVLLASGFGLALYPFSVALSSQVWQLIALAGFAGIFAAGSDLVLFDLLMVTAGTKRLGQSVGLYQTTSYIATIIAPLLATTFVDSIGIVPMLFVAAFLRTAGTVLFGTFGIGRESAESSATKS